MYEIIDEQLKNWVEDKELSLQVKFKDEDVRSINIISEKGNRYQIWCESNSRKRITINVWDYKKLKVVYETNDLFFLETIDRAYEMILLWDNYS